jgi:acyl-CoA synthetase (AMP-forming)/AMP-acid ligase II
VLQAYGMTEASHQMTSNPLPPAPREPGSVGVEAGASVRVVDDLWMDVPPGAAGEVVVAGPGVASGYLGNEEANATPATVRQERPPRPDLPDSVER